MLENEIKKDISCTLELDERYTKSSFWLLLIHLNMKRLGSLLVYTVKRDY